MRHTAACARPSGFTVLESLLMIGLMTVLSLMAWAIYLKETDPARQGPGVWKNEESSFVPAFREVDSPIKLLPDSPQKTRSETVGEEP